MTANPSAFPFQDHLHKGETEQPVLVEACIQELISLGGEAAADLLIELVDLYVEDSRTRMAEAMGAFEGGNLMDVSRAAHALKSASANMGAMAFSSICDQVEQLGRDGAGAELAGLVEQMKSMHGEVTEALCVLRSNCVS